MGLLTDYSLTIDYVRSLIGKSTKPTQHWPQLIKQMYGNGTATATKLSTMQLKDDVKSIATWIEQTLHRPKASAVKGLYFGLFHPDRAGNPSLDLSLTGCRSFDPHEQTWVSDDLWHCDTNPQSEVLHKLYPYSCRSSTNSARICIGLWYAMLALAELAYQQPALLGQGVNQRGIAVGFGSGDTLSLGRIVKGTFVPYSPPKAGSQPKPQLAKADYFKVEGNRYSLLAELDDGTLNTKSFLKAGLQREMSLHATLSDLSTKQGDFGTVDNDDDFGADFLLAGPAEKLRQLCPRELRLHRLTIQGMPSEYRILHVLQRLKAMNDKASNAEQRVILNKLVVAGHHVFNTTQYYDDALFVSREAAQLLIDAGIRGIAFCPVQCR